MKVLLPGVISSCLRGALSNRIVQQQLFSSVGRGVSRVKKKIQCKITSDNITTKTIRLISCLILLQLLLEQWVSIYFILHPTCTFSKNLTPPIKLHQTNQSLNVSLFKIVAMHHENFFLDPRITQQIILTQIEGNSLDFDFRVKVCTMKFVEQNILEGALQNFCITFNIIA